MYFLRRVPRLAIAMTTLGILASSATLGCATYRDELSRGRVTYEANQHDRALGTLRGLENDLSHFSDSERTQYFYLRGLTDYRIGYRSDARHWLALAQASDRQHPGALPEAWRARMEEALAVLNAEVYSRGNEAFTNEKRPPETQADSPASP